MFVFTYVSQTSTDAVYYTSKNAQHGYALLPGLKNVELASLNKVVLSNINKTVSNVVQP